MENLQLLQTLNARMCHDLVSSVSTIDNCLSLVDTNNKSISKKAKILLVEEADHLIKKIKLFRSAYGSSGTESHMSMVSFINSLKEFFLSTKVELKIIPEGEVESFNNLLAKACIALAALASEHINSNGTIEMVFYGQSSNIFMKIIASSNESLRDKFESSVMIFNSQNELPVNVTNCREHYINTLCNKIGYKVQVDRKEEVLEYSIALIE